MRGLQRTIPVGLGALESTQCNKTLCLPPTTFLFMCLQNEIHFAVVEGTQTARFSIEINCKISQMKGWQRRSLEDESGAQVFT